MEKFEEFKNITIAGIVFVIISVTLILFYQHNFNIFSQNNNTELPNIIKPNKPKYVRAIHLTAWNAGSKKYRLKIQQLFDKTELNTIVIAVKESNGEVYVPGVKLAEELKAYVSAMPDIEFFLKDLKSIGVYTVARIVVFKDNVVARKKPSWAVKNKEGNIWLDHKQMAWLDPFCKDAWEYNFSVAQRCIELGFEEIQFDYLRFLSDGDISNCRYSQVFSSRTAVNTIVEFLKEANNLLKLKFGVNISVDVFGLTTSAIDDMGIGQNIIEMAKYVDFICPMVYPSHYPKGTYGLKKPNSQPYNTVYRGLKDAVEKLKDDSIKLRPYLQDFSLGHKYNAKEVLAQIQALYDNNIAEWTLWNPGGVYTYTVFKSKEFSYTYTPTNIETSSTSFHQ